MCKDIALRVRVLFFLRSTQGGGVRLASTLSESRHYEFVGRNNSEPGQVINKSNRGWRSNEEPAGIGL